MALSSEGLESVSVSDSEPTYLSSSFCISSSSVVFGHLSKYQSEFGVHLLKMTSKYFRLGQNGIGLASQKSDGDITTPPSSRIFVMLGNCAMLCRAKLR
jgi:hypothetical protein